MRPKREARPPAPRQGARPGAQVPGCPRCPGHGSRKCRNCNAK
ncbi:hypothetical protein SAVERM_805 [Streptomyces avermitilis MA-4680 = NBRC 14893]|uniref:Uncharacterized protein n=1 Tax=Streptomyces avermitilis (strain ATCC 31267 / DSM 46492 / JCM 5070 / NBRC 14893 / NCIMB 12804 / NRRL 8165 / MA-4680) TaxID=227882 RepID=Q82PR7_STRAW|nr:hypothetical protein SAVERM_805 [Streptomyces avermitilis MA-4680 = NBRC 14893]